MVSCSVNQAFAKDLPSWFTKPRQNNIDVLYGIGEGASLEEATKNALADCAGKLVVSISSESQLTKEENQNSYNEELRQKVSQSIEKISFTGYQVSKSEEVNNRFYVEVSVEKDPFVNEQKERIEFVQRKISDLDKNSIQANPIQRRTSLIKILDLCKELELKARILSGAQEEVDLKSILTLVAKFQNEFEKSSSSIEFFFDPSSSADLLQILKSALNKDGLKDIISMGATNHKDWVIEVYFQNKTGGFDRDNSWIEYNININRSNQNYKNKLIYCDFDGDGYKDITYSDSGLYPYTNPDNDMKKKSIFLRKGNKFIEASFFDFDKYAKELKEKFYVL